MKRLVPALSALLSLGTLPAAAGAPLNVIIANDMAAAGRKLVRPTPEHPTYYVAVFRGYTDKGKPWGSSDPAPKAVPLLDIVQALVTETLAAHSYLPAIIDAPVDPKAPPGLPRRKVMAGNPSLILNIQWGYLAYRTISVPVHFQTSMMEAGGPLVTGHEADSNSTPSPEQIGLIGAQKIPTPGNLLDAALPRYYIIVDAIDYEAYQKSKKTVFMWRTRLSVPANSNSLSATLPAMLAAGGGAFGKDQNLPENVTVQVSPGKVIVGTPIEVGAKP